MTKSESRETALHAEAEAPDTQAEKKAYRKPVFRIYGDIASLTRSNALLASTADGGPILQSKTH